MELETLNVFSRSFADTLFAAKPEWLPFARIDENPKATPGSLVVEVPCPNSDGSGGPLWVGTDNDEVTLAFDRWHEHVGFSTGTSGADEFRAAIVRIDALIMDRIGIMVAMKGNLWRRSSNMEPMCEEAWIEFITAPGDFDHCYARTWLGTFNRKWFKEK